MTAISDSFTNTDGTDITAHDAGGIDWVKFKAADVATIEGNKVQFGNDGGNQASMILSGRVFTTDDQWAERAKVNVRNAGLADHIDIIEGDARQFRPADHGVTVAYAYLYPDLLAELRSMLETIPRLVTPWHPVDGMDGEQHGNVWVYRG